MSLLRVRAMPLGFWLTSWIALSPVAPACAQEGAVTGSGVAAIKRLPEVLRVHVEIAATGKDVKEALARLKDKQEASRASLKKLDAVAASVQFDEPRVKGENADQQRQLAMMARARMMQRGKKAKKQPPKPVTVSVAVKLTAEWKLAADKLDDLLIAAKAIEDKVRAADLGGLKEAENKPKSEEEEEMQDEAEQMGMGMHMGADGEPKPGEPVFLYVRRITEAERDKALADAFAKAKADAGRLAKAAGVQLLGLKSVNENASMAADDYADQMSRRQMYQMSRAQRDGPGDETDQSEAVGAQPGSVSYRVTVTAAFSVK